MLKQWMPAVDFIKGDEIRFEEMVPANHGPKIPVIGIRRSRVTIRMVKYVPERSSVIVYFKVIHSSGCVPRTVNECWHFRPQDLLAMQVERVQLDSASETARAAGSRIQKGKIIKAIRGHFRKAGPKPRDMTIEEMTAVTGMKPIMLIAQRERELEKQADGMSDK
jgi:hypothetical protein